jgi:dipeptidyl aminopeptidase/acylaminoacyl peptidase
MADNINIPWFVSREYLVFTPDIHYTFANTENGKAVGEAARDLIESAAAYLAQLPFVDGERMAIQGHSFGGGETFDVVAHSDQFAEACAVSATVADEISAYVGLSRPLGAPPSEYRFVQAETGHDRLGAALWERPDLYIRASSVLSADRVTTPLLIVANQMDGVDWGQSEEMYLALRRLGKRVWMLQYDGEGHLLSESKDVLDFTTRLTQFFDYYLKGRPPPRWMTGGIPAGLIGDRHWPRA